MTRPPRPTALVSSSPFSHPSRQWLLQSWLWPWYLYGSWVSIKALAIPCKVEDLIELCNSYSLCGGFNTNGFLKTTCDHKIPCGMCSSFPSTLLRVYGHLHSQVHFWQGRLWQVRWSLVSIIRRVKALTTIMLQLIQDTDKILGTNISFLYRRITIFLHEGVRQLHVGNMDSSCSDIRSQWRRAPLARFQCQEPNHISNSLLIFHNITFFLSLLLKITKWNRKVL